MYYENLSPLFSCLKIPLPRFFKLATPLMVFIKNVVKYWIFYQNLKLLTKFEGIFQFFRLRIEFKTRFVRFWFE